MIEIAGSKGAYELFSGSGLLPIYFGILSLLFLYIFYKYKVDRWTVFIVLLFTPNLFQYLGIDGLYKISITAYAIYLFFYSESYKLVKKYPIINTLFVLWTIAFFTSCFINDVPFLTTFSQYGVKYLFIYLIFFLSHRLLTPFILKEKIYRILKYCLLLQSVLSIIKFILWGVLGEALVGSLTTNGGGPNNIIPIVGFLLVWFHNKGHLSRNDWAYCLFLLISPVFGAKRSIWFFYPYVVAGVLFFADKTSFRTHIKTIAKYIPLLIIVFILGVKFNPTLNPENKFGGSFDLNYLHDYSYNYLIGNEDKKTGRAGSFISYIENYNSDINSTMLFGYGLDIMQQDYENFNTDLVNVRSKGEVGAALSNIYSFGIIGAISLLAFMISVLYQIRNVRLRFVIVSFMLIEFFTFYNSLMLTPSLLFVLMFSLYSFHPEGSKSNAFILKEWRYRKRIYGSTLK